MQEIYKDIIGYEGLYQVSNLGNVKSLRFGKEKILKSNFDRGGYLLISLWKNKVYKTFKVHRLVAQKFIPNPENKPQVNHKNGIKSDNRVENLEWLTISENQIHAYKIGLKFSYKGESNVNSKLTNEQVLKIRSDDRTQREIAKDYNIHYSIISDIKKGKRWNHI